MASNSKTNK